MYTIQVSIWDQDMVQARTPISSAEGSQETAGHHDGAASDDGSPAAKVVGHVGRYEEGDDGADVEHVDEDG